MDKRVIDVACGSKQFWFDKNNKNVEFCDNRTIPYHEYYPHRYIEVSPDTVCDFTALPFEDGSFKLVVFDPPHLNRVGENTWIALKYGCLKGDWKEMLRNGFSECFRVLDPDGVLIFKWSEVQIPLRDILSLAPYPPLFGHRSGKNMNTHWLCFMRPVEKVDDITHWLPIPTPHDHDIEIYQNRRMAKKDGIKMASLEGVQKYDSSEKSIQAR